MWHYTLPPVILKAYDIRGLAHVDLTVEAAHAIGWGFCQLLLRRELPLSVVVTRDGRLSSPALAEALINGLRVGGADVIDCGLGPTPLCYYAIKNQGVSGGIMVTGSHNPKEYNGFKMAFCTGPCFGDEIKDLGRIVQEGAPHILSEAPLQGSLRVEDLRASYVESVLKTLTSLRPLNVVWDLGNGAAGAVVSLLLPKLPGRHIVLNGEIDGYFPKHDPDPTKPENLVELQRRVLEEKADLGVAFDGDADRLVVVDETGFILQGDQLLALLAKEILKRNPGASIIADIKCSDMVFQVIREEGGKPLLCKTGHSFIKNMIRETGALFGGEMSGHFFFNDCYGGYDDGIYAALRTFEIVSHGNQSLSQMRENLPTRFSTPEIRLSCEETKSGGGDTKKFDVVDGFAQYCQKKNLDISLLDGVRFQTAEGWGLLRASNTEPALIIRCEGNSIEGLASLKDILQEGMLEIGADFGQIF